MDRFEKLIELLEKKYNDVPMKGTNKSRIREIVREEIQRVSESLKEVDDSQVSMTFASLERANKYSMGIYRKMKESGVEDVDGWVFAKITLAEDYLKSVYSYLDGKDGLDDTPNTSDDIGD